MMELNDLDYELIERAKEIIKKHYDGLNFTHTVGAAIRGKNNKIYVGINVYSIHGMCAEQVAIGNALISGEKEFTTIVAVDGENSEVIPPCGNCRQMFNDYMKDIDVIIKDNDKLIKVKASELLPYSYKTKF